jgi:hypothetical protein
MRPNPRWSCPLWPRSSYVGPLAAARLAAGAPIWLSHSRFARPPIHFIADSLTVSAPLLHSRYTDPAAALRNLKLAELRKRALSAGMAEAVVQRALDREEPRAAMVGGRAGRFSPKRRFRFPPDRREPGAFWRRRTRWALARAGAPQDILRPTLM